jgi:tetratricopeptide (TPR) repeat protein
MKPVYLLVPVLVLSSARASASNEAHAVAPNVLVARSHFLRGVELYRSGAYDAALAEFSRAHDSAPHYRILYNLAQIQAQRHDYVASLELFRQYLEQGAGEISEARAAEVASEMAELTRRIARLHVESNVDGARLFVNDGPPVELPLPAPLLVNAGIHRLRLEKPGYLPAFRTVTLTGGDELSFSLDLSAELEMDEAPSLAALEPPQAPPEAPAQTALWASLAATGVLTGAAVTFGVLALGADNELDRQLADDTAPRGLVEGTRERVRTYDLLTDAFGVAAATALGVSAYFFFSAPSAAPSDEDSRLRAVVTPRGAEMWWTTAF